MVKMEETIGTAPAGVPAAGAAITVHVKFGGRTISVSLSPESTGSDLKSRLQSLTDVLPRGQRLIFKGKVVADAMSLKSLQITDGSKVMLIASQGLHQGDGLVLKNVAAAASNLRNNPSAHQNQVHKTAMTIGRTRSERWKLTGVVALSDCHVKAIPDEVWDCGPSVRVLDMCNNLIQELPDKVGSLKSLTKLYLNANDLSDGKVSWDGLSQLKSLTTLSFNHNKLTTLPSDVGDLISLTQLHIAKNKLTFLPDELGCLNQLQILKVGSNRISSVPASIGNCSSLTEIDLSSNLLIELPETFGKLRNLKAHHPCLPLYQILPHKNPNPPPSKTLSSMSLPTDYFSRRCVWVNGPIIVGAGPSGLATAACLREQGVPFVILERADCIASLWQRRTYDRLRLHLPKQFCELPLLQFPKHLPQYPNKQQFIDYLESYAKHFSICSLFNQTVQSAGFDDACGLWRVKTVGMACGNNRRATEVEYLGRWLVAATGENAEKVVPDIEGITDFGGSISHVCDYKSGKEYAGKQVLVVGCGNSGMEVSLDLCYHNAFPSMVVRDSVHVLPREVLGKSTFELAASMMKWLPMPVY